MLLCCFYNRIVERGAKDDGWDDVCLPHSRFVLSEVRASVVLVVGSTSDLGFCVYLHLQLLLVEAMMEVERSGKI